MTLRLPVTAFHQIYLFLKRMLNAAVCRSTGLDLMNEFTAVC